MNAFEKTIFITLLISSGIVMSQPNPLGWLTGKGGTATAPTQACPPGCQPITTCKYKTTATTLPAEPKCPDACIASSVCEEN
jgi:hypothetical protein